MYEVSCLIWLPVNVFRLPSENWREKHLSVRMLHADGLDQAKRPDSS